MRAHEEDKLRRLIASPAFARANIFDEDLAAKQMYKSCIVLNCPMSVGMSILDLSKHLMYYNQLQRQYGDLYQLLYTDTRSLLLENQTKDVNEDMAKSAGHYDVRLPRGPPTAQHSEQEGAGEDERRVCRQPNPWVYRLAPVNVLYLGGQW